MKRFYNSRGSEASNFQPMLKGDEKRNVSHNKSNTVTDLNALNLSPSKFTGKKKKKIDLKGVVRTETLKVTT